MDTDMRDVGTRTPVWLRRSHPSWGEEAREYGPRPDSPPACDRRKAAKTPPMREEFRGYYRPTDDEFKELWDSALIVPDTNVLLTLYRLSEETRKRLLGIFEALTDRLFLSHQVGYEFQERRLGVIEEQKKVYDTVLAQIEDFPEGVGRDLREHPRLDPNELKTRLESALRTVKEYLEEVREEHPDPLTDGDAIGADAIRDVLDEVFANSVGPPRNMTALTKEGASRYKEKRPPGYEDKRKDEPRCYGDLAIWLDTIDAAKSQSKDVIFITAERKADWWWLRGGKIIAPRPELIAEMREKANQAVYLYDIERFMEEASKTLGLEEITDEERVDVARAQRTFFTTTLDPANLSDWSKVELSEIDPWKIKWIKDPAQWPDLSTIDTSKFEFFPGPKPFEWRTSVQVDGPSVRIDLRLQPSLFFPEGSNVARQISCLVQGPNGAKSEALLTDAPLEANISYPDDFVGEIEEAEGTYRYTWFVSGGRGLINIPNGEVANGSFELGGRRR